MSNASECPVCGNKVKLNDSEKVCPDCLAYLYAEGISVEQALADVPPKIPTMPAGR